MKPTKSGLYLCITPKIIGVIKIIGQSPYLKIKSGIDLINFWKNDAGTLMLPQELSYIESLLNTNKIVFTSINDEEELGVFKNAFWDDALKGNIEFDQESVDDWLDIYKSYLKNGIPTTNLIQRIMFDGPYTVTQAKLIYDYIVKRYNANR